MRREQALVYLAVKKGAIRPEDGTRVTFMLRELVKSIESEESGPLDEEDAGASSSSERSTTDLPRLRALLAAVTGRDMTTGAPFTVKPIDREVRPTEALETARGSLRANTR